MNAVSAGGLIFNGDKICFIRFTDGKLSFPKGSQEEGESIEQTAIREVVEETGLRNPVILEKLGVVTRVGHNHNQEVMKDIHLFLMTVESYEQNEADEATEWHTPEEALSRMLPEEALFLQNYVSRHSH